MERKTPFASLLPLRGVNVNSRGRGSAGSNSFQVNDTCHYMKYKNVGFLSSVPFLIFDVYHSMFFYSFVPSLQSLLKCSISTSEYLSFSFPSLSVSPSLDHAPCFPGVLGVNTTHWGDIMVPVQCQTITTESRNTRLVFLWREVHQRGGLLSLPARIFFLFLIPKKQKKTNVPLVFIISLPSVKSPTRFCEGEKLQCSINSEFTGALALSDIPRTAHEMSKLQG